VPSLTIRVAFVISKRASIHKLANQIAIEGLAQVHSVAFAQLGALAHSIMELGCGYER